MNIGGMAFGRGISFTNGERQTRVTRQKDGSYRFSSRTVRSSGLTGRVSRIPFLRGVLSFFRIKAMLALLLVAILADLSPLFGGEQSGAVEDFASWAAVAILAVLVAVRLFFLQDMLKYHAAEHMAINTFESEKELTFQNISRASRTHPRCGTMLAIYIVIVAIPCAVFLPYVSAALLLTVSVAYELFVSAPKVRALKWLSELGLWLQKAITTAPPEARHIETARQGMLRLLSEYRR